MTDSTRKINLALVVSELTLGGAERQVVEIAKNIDKRRFNVHIIALSTHNPLMRGEEELRASLVIVEKRSRFDASVVSRLARVFKQYSIEVAHAFLFDAGLSTRLAGVLARTEVVIDSERNSDYRPTLLRKSFQIGTRRLVDAIVANSHAGAAYHRKLYGLPEHKYRVVHNGVNTEKFKPAAKAPLRRRLELPADIPVFGMFANFKRQKNHPLLFDALRQVKRQVPDFRVLLVGDTLEGGFGDTHSYKADVLKALDASGVAPHIVFLGKRDDIQDIYPACDFTVLSSNHEGTPNVVLESMSCGVAPIVTDVSDNRLVVTSGRDGVVVAPRNAAQLAAAIVDFIQHDDKAAEYGRQARQTMIKHYSNRVMAAKMAEVYLELLGRGPAQNRDSIAMDIDRT